MKRLNRKGFTLIELLAIIVILAIIMVVTIPNVLTSMGTAREEMFQTSVNTVADWVEKQYTYAMIQQYDKSFVGVCGNNSGIAGLTSTPNNNFCASQYVSTATTDNAKIESNTANANAVTLLKAAGVDPTNYSKLEILVTNGRACVKLTAAAGGDFNEYKGTTKNSTGC